MQKQTRERRAGSIYSTKSATPSKSATKLANSRYKTSETAATLKSFKENNWHIFASAEQTLESRRNYRHHHSSGKIIKKSAIHMYH